MKFFSKKTHSRPSAVYQHEFHVLRVWAFSLAVFFVGLIISAIIHVIILTRVSDERLFGRELSDEGGGDIISASSINDAAANLDERKKEFDGVGAGPAPVDPS